MIARVRRLPLTVRLPMMVAAMIFAAAVATTQIVIYGLSMQFERQMTQVAEAYLDGLAAALLPSVTQDDRPEIKQVLDRNRSPPARRYHRSGCPIAGGRFSIGDRSTANPTQFDVECRSCD